MAAGLDTKRLGLVFQSRPDILAGIQAAADSPARVKLFNDIVGFVHDQLATPDEPASKRRRVDVDQAGGGGGGGASSSAANGAEAAAGESVLLEVKDISVSIPQRKKYDLVFTKNHLYARASGATAPVPGIVYAWKDIEYVFYLPVPEKTQLQHNYVVFPRNTCLAAIKPPAAPGGAGEPLLFTVPATAPKPGSVGGSAAAQAAAVSDTYSSLFDWALTAQLRSAGNSDAKIVAADPRAFHSVVRQAHRPGERAVHVKGFRGSKDGYLFFLPNGILWGFKKPLLFMPLERIVAVSYTSVLQRTFNMVVEVDLSEPGGEEQTEEVEFGMLDQEDYGGIDEAYVKRHGLQDRSMAERRKAKRELAENARGGKKGAAGEGEEGDAEGAGGGGGGDDDDGMTELERAHREAEQLLQDDEDEDEEDYDPGSEGESEGEGSSSGEEDDDDDDDDEDGEEGDEEEEEPDGYASDAEEGGGGK